MFDTLDRERLIDNLVDRVFKLEERVRVLEAKVQELGDVDVIVPEPDTGGRWQLVMVDRGTPRGVQLEAWELL